MSTPRDLSLERFGDRDRSRPDPLGEVARVGSPLGINGTRDIIAAYQALIDAVFTAPGASEWLSSLRLAVVAMVADKKTSPRAAVANDAIRSAHPDSAQA